METQAESVLAGQAVRLGIPYDLLCQECGYNLRGLTSARCPECGQELDAVLSTESRIPWVHREKLGHFRAYWKTVFWVSFQYKRFCEEIARPVDYADAQRFRWVTILHAFIPLAILMGFASAEGAFDWRIIEDVRRGIPTWWPYAAAASADVITFWWLLAATGSPSYFFETRTLPPQTRNSAIAISYYCCGGLAWFAPLLVLSVVSIGLIAANLKAGAWLSLFVGSLLFVSLADWYLNLLRTLRRILPDCGIRRVAAAMFLPFIWLAVGAVPLLVLVPLVYAATLIIVVW